LILALGSLLLLACEDAPPAVDAAAIAADLAPAVIVIDLDGGGDGPSVEADLAEPTPQHGTRCGDALCVAEAQQYCHTSDWGVSGLCLQRPSASPGYYGCDGPEDCLSATCCLLGAASACGSLGFCVAGRVVGEVMCHGDLECGQASRCCPLGAAGSYRSCVDGLAADEPCPPRA